MPWADPEDESPRFQHHIRAAGEGEIAFAVVQAAAGHMHGDQARRTCRVHRERGTVDPQGISDAPGRQAETGAGEPVRPLHGVRIGGQ